MVRVVLLVMLALLSSGCVLDDLARGESALWQLMCRDIDLVSHDRHGGAYYEAAQATAAGFPPDVSTDGRSDTSSKLVQPD